MRNTLLLLCACLLFCSFGNEEEEESTHKHKGKLKTVVESHPYYIRKSTEVITRQYDYEGRIIEQTEYVLIKRRKGTTNQPSRRYTFTYNDAGQVTKITEQGLWYPWTNPEITEFNYDEKGNKIEARHLSHDNATGKNFLNSKELMTYDAHGRLTGRDRLHGGKKNMRANDSTIAFTDVERHIYEYNEGTKTEKVRFSNSDEYTLQRKYNYDLRGNLIKNTYYEKDKPSFVDIYLYDDENKLLQRTHRDYKNRSAYSTTYNYENADAKGNFLTISSPKGKRKKSVTTFSFEYYE